MKALNKLLLPHSAHDWAGLLVMPMRWIAGWAFFSAFWRRLVLDNKLDPEQAGYVGEKFNHFLPNALFIRPSLEWMVSHPDFLHWFLLAFTIIEGLVGLAL